jgi:hypothetical protein
VSPSPSPRHTPGHSVRVPTEVWDAARARADRDHTTVTAVIVRALRRYAAADLKAAHQEDQP